jgi:pSer/pThr/pTyr-binding forkhead associated (FHA) protein
MEEDDDLSMGEFGIATRMVQPQRGRAAREVPAEVKPQAAPSETKIFRPPASDTEAVSSEEAAVHGLAHTPAALVLGGKRHELANRSLVVGRSRDCDISVDDPNVSRRHAEIKHENGAYWIVDLGSTNGVTVNGERVKRAKLEPDDSVVLGTTELRFERGF